MSIAIYWDSENVSGTEEQIRRLLQFACGLGVIAFKRAYADWGSGRVKTLAEFFHKSEFDCLHVPPEKNSADYKLIDDCEKQVLNNPAISTVILLSGDKDFSQLVRELKKAGKKVIVIFQHLGKTSRKLMELADEHHELKSLCD